MSRYFAWFAGCAVLVIALSAGAQEKLESVEEVQSEAAEAGEPEKPWYLWGSVDFRSQYFFRGYMQNPSWYIIQPNAEFGYTVWGDEAFSITPFVGTWMNFTEDKGPGSPAHFNEIDYIGGADLLFHEKLTLRMIYTYYDSPSDAFGTIQEVGGYLRYDGLGFGPFEATNPVVGIYREVANEEDAEHTYMEFLLEPTLKAIEAGTTPITVSFPMALGTSLDDFYTDSSGSNEFFGFASVGVKGSVPLPLDEKFGLWFFDVTVEYMYLFADSAQESNGGDDDDVVLWASLRFQF